MEKKDEKKEGVVTEAPGVPKAPEKKIRQIIIETDGDSINLVKAEVSGKIELAGIFRNLLEYIAKS